MSNSEIDSLQQGIAIQTKSLTNTNKVETAPVAYQDTVNVPALLCLFVFLCLYTLAIMTTSRIKRKKQCSIPCRTCQFFSNNTHLKCAVQPTLVLTEEAKHCPDYDMFVYRRQTQQKDEKAEL
jgi:hypothetical protein